jgi:ribose transport system permease protein
VALNSVAKGSDAAPPESGAKGRSAAPAMRAHSRLGAIARRFTLVGVWLAVIALFGVLRPDTFLTTSNFQTIFGTQSVIVIAALGLLLPLTAGEYDLSVGFTLTLAAMVVALLNVNHDWSIGAAIVAALAVGSLVGAINGGLVVFFGVDAFIATLGTGTFVQGVIYWISDSNTITGVSNTLVDAVVQDRLFGISLEFYYGLAIAAIIWYVFEFTPLGRRLLIVGRGPSVAKLSGIRVPRVRWGAFVGSGLISAVAGVVYVGTTGAADPTSGTQFLLPAFAAAFLGATTIMPGRFNPWGSVVATYFLITGITGLQLLGAQSFVQQLFYGGALVTAVALSQIARGRRPGAD